MGGKLSASCHDQASSTAATDHDLADTSFALTDNERKLIDSTWKQLIASSDTNFEEELGVRVFIRIFELDPSITEAFPHFVGLLGDHESMRRNVMFRCHGRRFLRAVRSIVDNLDSLGVTAVPNLDLLGRKHRNIHGFRGEYLRTFEAAMEGVWREALGRKYDKSTSVAWRKVFKLITSTVLHGYEASRNSPLGETSATKAEQKTVATPNDINGSLAYSDSQSDCGLSS